MSKGKKEMQTLPIGSKTEEAWRMVDELAPDKADALAVSALRYALTGENADGPGVPSHAWAKAKGEIDLLLARRGANPWGCKGKPNGEPNGEPNAEPSAPLPSSTEEGRPKREEGRGKNNPKPVDEDAREVSAVGGFSPPSGSADFAAWAATQKDPVAVALAASGEGADKAKVYGARLRELRALKGGAEGARLFVAECVTFHAELRAGEECRNPGAALVARLKSLREALKGGATVAPTATPPREAEPAAAPADADGEDAEADAALAELPPILAADAPADAAPGLTPKQARILAWVEAARCGSAEEARMVALSYPEEGGATAADADAVLEVLEAKQTEGGAA